MMAVDTIFYTMVVLMDGTVDYLWVDTARESVYNWYDQDEIAHVYYDVETEDEMA